MAQPNSDSNTAFSNIDLSAVKDALPDQALPELPPGPLGRFRLVQALQARYGVNYRSIPVAKRALDSFDQETGQVRDFMLLKEQINGQRI